MTQKIFWLLHFVEISVLAANYSTQNNLSPSILIGKLDPSIYDKFLPPQKALHNESTLVLTDIYVERLSSVQEASMDYDIDFYLHLEWYDQRLSYDGREFLETNDLEIAEKLWWPDLYIANAKESTFPSITVPNFSVRVYADGKIWISRRIRSTLPCKMHLAKFPSDKQHCGLKLLTYLSAGTYSCLYATFELTRYAGYHLFQTFIPSTIVVLISWIGFWITPRAVPARVTLSITTFLALSTQFQGVKIKLPAISYATAIDIWTTICTVFVFAALLEFTVSYHLWETENLKSVTDDNKIQDEMSDNSKRTWICHRNHKVSNDGQREQSSQSKTMNSSKVDRASRILFPLSFLICSIIYWWKYPPNI